MLQKSDYMLSLGNWRVSEIDKEIIRALRRMLASNDAAIDETLGYLNEPKE